MSIKTVLIEVLIAMCHENYSQAHQKEVELEVTSKANYTVGLSLHTLSINGNTYEGGNRTMKSHDRTSKCSCTV